MDTPAGLYSTYTALEEPISVYARFVVFDESKTPVRIYAMNAKSIEIEGTEVTPIKELVENTTEYKHVAEYIGPDTTNSINETTAIIYHIDEFTGLCKQNRIQGDDYEQSRDRNEIPHLPNLTQYIILAELHELCHWAISDDEQPDSTDHWATWNAILKDTIQYSSPDISWHTNQDYELEKHPSNRLRVPDVEQNNSIIREQSEKTKIQGFLDFIPDDFE